MLCLGKDNALVCPSDIPLRLNITFILLKRTNEHKIVFKDALFYKEIEEKEDGDVNAQYLVN